MDYLSIIRTNSILDPKSKKFIKSTSYHKICPNWDKFPIMVWISPAHQSEFEPSGWFFHDDGIVKLEKRKLWLNRLSRETRVVLKFLDLWSIIIGTERTSLKGMLAIIISHSFRVLWLIMPPFPLKYYNNRNIIMQIYQ